MKTIIAGSRHINDYNLLLEAIEESGFKITEVVCGGAKGVDALGYLYARTNNLIIDLYPADWAKYGLSAGPRRNAEMANNAEALIAIWNGISPGTKNMIDLAKNKWLKVYIKIVDEEIKS